MQELETQKAVPQALTVTEEMHVAAVKVLQRANGLDGLPQRMLDAMLAAAPAQQTQEQPLSFDAKSEERKPLTNEQMRNLILDDLFPHGITNGDLSLITAVIRHAERAHGIGVETK